MTQQHITQEQAVDLAEQHRMIRDGYWESDRLKLTAVCNAAIQHYIEQRAKEFPTLPEPLGYLCDWGDDSYGLTRQTVYYGEPGSAIEDDWNEHPKVHENLPIHAADQLQAYGDARAAHARELALMDAITQVTTLYEKDDYPVLTDICNLIATAK